MLRVVIPHAFIEPPRPDYSTMSIRALQKRFALMKNEDEDVPNRELFPDDEDYQKALKDLCQSREEGGVLKKTAKVACQVLLYGFKEDEDNIADTVPYLQVQIPPYQFEAEYNAKHDQQQGDILQSYERNVNIEPATSRFGLTYFNSDYRFNFINLEAAESGIQEEMYIEIRLKDAEEKIIKEDVGNQDQGMFNKLWNICGNNSESKNQQQHLLPNLARARINSVRVKKDKEIVECSLYEWIKEWTSNSSRPPVARASFTVPVKPLDYMRQKNTTIWFKRNALIPHNNDLL